MTVTVYRSTDASAPQLSSATSSTTDVAAILEACLVNGYGSMPDQGWTMPYTGASSYVFRQPVGTSNGFYLRLDVSFTGATSGHVGRDVAFRGYESMTSADVGTGPFPTVTQSSTGVYQMRNITNGSALEWALYTNGAIFYFVVGTGSAKTVLAFGDIAPLRTGDAYATLLCGNNYDRQASYHSYAYSQFPRTVGIGSANSANFMARSYTQLGSSIWVGKHVDYVKTASTIVWGSGGMTYPNPADNKMWFVPAWVHEVGVLRGVLPGVWAPCHNLPLTSGDIFTATGDLAGRQFEAVTMTGALATGGLYDVGQVFFELTDNW